MPSRAKAVEAKCHRCMGEYVDGLVDCEVVECPLYPWMPYRAKEPSVDWEKYSARRKGLQPVNTMSDERRKQMAANFPSGRGKKGLLTTPEKCDR